MPLHAFTRGSSSSSSSIRTTRMAAMLRLWVVGLLLSGGFISVLAQGNNDNKKARQQNDKDKAQNDKDKDKNKNKGKQTNFPSSQPTPLPSGSPSAAASSGPTGVPTFDPITATPTHLLETKAPTLPPTSGPSLASAEAYLPEITFDIVTVVDDVFSFAALLEQHQNNDDPDDDGLKAFFRKFFVDLLVASRVVATDALDSVDLDVQLLPSESDKTQQESNSFEAMPKSATATAAAAGATAENANPDDTAMRVVIDGTMVYHPHTGDEDEDESILLLEDKMSHTLAVYFSFWKTDEMVAMLSEYGLKDPRIRAVRVDDKVILTADQSAGTEGDGLVVPTDSGSISAAAESSAAALESSSGHGSSSGRVVAATSVLVVLWTALA
eukprot:jgi/Psemu1/55475/gm1.55475_g